MIATQHKIVLIRHAESEKNIKTIHGGIGEKLTPNGIIQIRRLANSLSAICDRENTKIYASSSCHTKYTAVVLSDLMGIDWESQIDFRPLYLGIADGKSESEMRKLYPREQLLFEKWRKREIDIKELIIDGMEDYMQFWTRGTRVLESVSHSTDNILVCSNSLMILFVNIMLGNHPQLTNKYKHISIPNCGRIVFSTQDYLLYSLDCINTDVDLPL